MRFARRLTVSRVNGPQRSVVNTERAVRSDCRRS
jgi:hypothetical protein